MPPPQESVRSEPLQSLQLSSLLSSSLPTLGLTLTEPLPLHVHASGQGIQ